jgi:hypothetical protein
MNKYLVPASPGWVNLMDSKERRNQEVLRAKDDLDFFNMNMLSKVCKILDDPAL